MLTLRLVGIWSSLLLRLRRTLSAAQPSELHLLTSRSTRSEPSSRDVSVTQPGRSPRSTLRRLDQAAGAADAAREARSDLRVVCGSQEVSCDPLSPHHAGGAPAPKLLA